MKNRPFTEPQGQGGPKRQALRRIRLSFGGATTTTNVEAPYAGTGEKRGVGRIRMATIATPDSYTGSRKGSGFTTNNSPAYTIGRAIERALDPNYAPKPVRTLADMTVEEKAKMFALYGKKDKP